MITKGFFFSIYFNITYIVVAFDSDLTCELYTNVNVNEMTIGSAAYVNIITMRSY